MKSFIAKRVISILVNLRYLRFKLLKYKENKKICYTFDHNFKNIPLYIMSNVSLERYYFVLYDGALTLKMSKMALNAFCDKTLHIDHACCKATAVLYPRTTVMRAECTCTSDEIKRCTSEAGLRGGGGAVKEFLEADGLVMLPSPTCSLLKT